MLRQLLIASITAVPTEMRPASPPLHHMSPVRPGIKPVQQVSSSVRAGHAPQASQCVRPLPMLLTQSPFGLMNASGFSTAARVELDRQAEQAAKDLLKKVCRERDLPRSHWVDTSDAMNGIDVINTSKISRSWLDHHPVKQLNIILHHAARVGDWQSEAVQLILLDNSLPSHYRLHCLANVLPVAAMCGHTAFVRFLLQHGAPIDERYENVEGTWVYREQIAKDDVLKGCTPLLGAVVHRHVETAALLLEHQADVDRRSTLLPVHHRDYQHYANIAPMHIAAANGDIGMVNLLLKFKAHIDAENAFGETPLLFAVWKGHKKVVRLLLEHGADAQHQSEWGVPMHELTEDVSIKELLSSSPQTLLTMRLR